MPSRSLQALIIRSRFRYWRRTDSNLRSRLTRPTFPKTGLRSCQQHPRRRSCGADGIGAGPGPIPVLLVHTSGSLISTALFASVGARRDHVTGGKATVTKVGRAGSAPAGYFATNRQIHGGSSRPERSDSRDRDLGETVDALCAIDDLPTRPSVRRRWRDLSPPTAMDRAALSKR
jgi:hypothetical protein